MMKRSVTAAENSRYDIIEQQLDSQLDAYNAGYKITAVEEDGSFALEARQDQNMMPVFFITPIPADTADVVVYDVEMQFPNIFLGELQYADDAEHWINEWQKAAKLATQIKKLEIDLV